MARKTFITRMPDQAGAFLTASERIARHRGNIVRVSYNKAIDPHMLFLDVEAPAADLPAIEAELENGGYLCRNLARARVIELCIRIPDRPGALLPVLRVLGRYDVNISYMNSRSSGAPRQDFRMGLLIEDPPLIRTLLEEISRIDPVDVIECDSSEENLDNTVFYIRLANEIQGLLDLSEEKMMQFLSESNRILQELQAGGEDARRVFATIRRFARFVSGCRGENFRADVEHISLGGGVTLWSIQPPCGSNTYVFDAPGEYVLIDTGYALYEPEMARLFRRLFPGWESRPKRVYITHADVDHCGLLGRIPGATIYVNQKSADSLRRQARGLPDFRENTPLRFGYSKVSRILSGYEPPDPAILHVYDRGTPRTHAELLPIGALRVAELEFVIYEGSGGHLDGEMVYACPAAGVVFTGDILVNIRGFSRERAEFNSLAPFLMKSVNVDSRKATAMRRAVTALIGGISAANGRPCLVCGGHGPLSVQGPGGLRRLTENPENLSG